MVSAGVVITTGVNNEGHQGWPGFDVITTEDWARWAALRRSSVARGLSCMALVTSDDRSGLKVESPPSCRAGWQRCRVHFSTDLSARVPKACQGARGRHPGVHDLEPPDHDSVWDQHAREVYQLAGHFDAAAAMLADAAGPRSRSRLSRPSTGPTSGTITLKYGSIKNGKGGPMLLGYSPTGQLSPAWLALCSPSITTGGGSQAVTGHRKPCQSSASPHRRGQRTSTGRRKSRSGTITPTTKQSTRHARA